MLSITQADIGAMSCYDNEGGGIDKMRATGVHVEAYSMRYLLLLKWGVRSYVVMRVIHKISLKKWICS